MKPVIIGVTAVVVVVATAGALRARPAHTGTAHYNISRLAVPSRFKNISIVAMNDSADVVANASVDGKPVVVVIRSANNASPTVIVFPTPSGSISISASGIDDQGAISAQAVRAGGWLVPYVGFSSSNSHSWSRLPVKQRASYSVAGMAANGDVAGTMMSAKGRPGRAIEWKYAGREMQPGGKPYNRPEMLRLSPGYTHSGASSIWSSGPRELIAGTQYKGGRPSERLTLWRWLPFCLGAACSQPDQSSVPGGGLTPLGVAQAHIGGWGGHMYVSGRVMGIDTGSGWRASLRYTSRGVRAVSFARLPLPTYVGAECFSGTNGVSAGAKGRFLGVGEISCIGSKSAPEALLWRGTKVVALQSRIPPASHWKLTGAAALNRRGEVVGSGTFKGRSAIFLLSKG